MYISQHLAAHTVKGSIKNIYMPYIDHSSLQNNCNTICIISSLSLETIFVLYNLIIRVLCLMYKSHVYIQTHAVALI